MKDKTVTLTNAALPGQPNPYTDPSFDGSQDVEVESTFLAGAQKLLDGEEEIGNTTSETLAFLRNEHDNFVFEKWYQLCLSLTRQARGLVPVAPDAITAWQMAEHRHPLKAGEFQEVPKGAPIFYRGGLHGHIVTFRGYSKDNVPMVWTNDALRRGGVDSVATDWFPIHWGFQLLGWTEDLNGFDLQLNEPTKKPTIKHPHLTKLQRLRNWRDGIREALDDAKHSHDPKRVEVLEFRLRQIHQLIKEA